MPGQTTDAVAIRLAIQSGAEKCVIATNVSKVYSEDPRENPEATYGEIMVRSALEQGAVATLLLSEAITKMRMRWFCKECKNEWETTHEKSSANPSCPECKSGKVNEDKENSMELIDELTILAGRTSAKVRLISLDTEEGSTLYTAFGGITALLRYPIS